MTATDVATSFSAQQRATSASTATAVAERWSRIQPDAILDSWGELIPAVAGLVAAGQLRAAQAGAAYTPAIVRQQQIEPQTTNEVDPAAFAGIASDGRPLDTLLALPAAMAVGRISNGQSTPDALSQGRRHMTMLAATQILDAGRLAASVGMVAEKKVFGYRRQLTTPSCGRCAILAGKWFGWNTGFERHPECDCVHVPAVGPKSDLGGVESFDPQSYFASLDPASQDRYFTKGGAQAIRDGADMGQVVNARRGMKTTRAYGRKISTTTVGTTRRASAARIMYRETGGQFRKTREGGRYGRINVPRLSPEQIYADAKDRDDAIRLLGRFGYLPGSAPPIPR